MSEHMLQDVDPLETNEWLSALESVVREEGLSVLSIFWNKYLIRPV